MKIKYGEEYFKDIFQPSKSGDAVEYYLDVTFNPLRVLAIYVNDSKLNRDITHLWEQDDIENNLEDGVWREFE
jgi:hypothetical protein